MIGNDIVDLGQRRTQEGAQHPRFDERVFAPVEREAIAASGAPERLRWMFWAAKEAAYKVAKKERPDTVWSARRFVVDLDADLKGSVTHEDRKYPVRILAEADWVHALASDGAHASRQRFGVACLTPGSDASAVVRDRALEELADELAEELGAASHSLRVEKRDRIPILCEGERVIDVDLSLSHHGRFVAWAADLGGTAPWLRS